MTYRVGIVAAAIILAFVLRSVWFIENDTEATSGKLTSVEIEGNVRGPPGSSTEVDAESIIDAENYEQPQESGVAANSFGRVSPAEIENDVMQRIAEQPDLELTSLNSVNCDVRTCTVTFTGLDADPQFVGDYSDLYDMLLRTTSDDYRPTSGSISTREVSPGAREYVVGISYVALVDTSDDKETAARQHAACAGAWARVTQQRGSDDYIRGAHERSAEWLDRSARVLGLEEAQHLADELKYGPLTRDCHAVPY